jgi:CRISPR-associated protein Cas2
MTGLCVLIYDIPCDRRRTKLHQLLKQYGEPVQKSAFEARLTMQERKELLRRARALLEESEDQLIVYRIGKGMEEGIEVIGPSRPEIGEGHYYVV